MSRAHLLRRLVGALMICSLLCVGAMLGSLSIGTTYDDSHGQWRHVVTPLPTLLHLLADPSAAGASGEERSLLDIRLPRVLLAAIVGASLALAGAAFQGLLRSSLADPYIVGTSSGAALGAALSVVLGVSSGMAAPHLGKPLFAFVGALLTMYCVYRLAQRNGRLPVDTFLLSGVVVGAFVWAFVSFLLAVTQDKMKEIVFWLMGDLSAADWGLIWMSLPYLLIGGLVLLALAHPMNLLASGEERALQLGVPVERVKTAVIVFAALITAGAVSVSGLIGFVGLMVPHLVRSAWGADHRVLLPATAIAGAAFLVTADAAARLLLSPAGLPVGVVTALLGGPFFFFILRRGSRWQ
jgi:iron complex transport system permease protein